MKLLEFQKPYYERLIKFFNSDSIDRGQLFLACGSGKTYAISIALKDSKIDKKKIIFLTSRRSLIDQTKKVLESIFQNHQILIKRENSNKEKAISKFVESEKDSILLLTYKSFSEIENELKTSLFEKTNVFLFDECHILYGSTKKKIFRQLRELLSFEDSKKRRSKKLFFSATELNYDQYLEHISARDFELFGPIIYEEDAFQLIENQYLRRVEIDLETISRFSFQSLRSKNELKIKEIEFFETVVRENSSAFEKIVVFFDQIEDIEFFLSRLKTDSVKDYELIQIDHRIKSKKEVSRRLRRFSQKNRKAILLNCEIVSEGFSAPYIDAIFYFTNKSTIRFLIQSSGRATRALRSSDDSKILERFRENPSKIYFYIFESDDERLKEISNRRKENLKTLLSFYSKGFYDSIKTRQQSKAAINGFEDAIGFYQEKLFKNSISELIRILLYSEIEVEFQFRQKDRKNFNLLNELINEVLRKRLKTNEEVFSQLIYSILKRKKKQVEIEKIRSFVELNQELVDSFLTRLRSMIRSKDSFKPENENLLIRVLQDFRREQFQKVSHNRRARKSLH